MSYHKLLMSFCMISCLTLFLRQWVDNERHMSFKKLMQTLSVVNRKFQVYHLKDNIKYCIRVKSKSNEYLDKHEYQNS